MEGRCSSKESSAFGRHKGFKIRPSPCLGDDTLAWASKKSGVFSVSDAYNLALVEYDEADCATSAAPDGRRASWDTIWKCPVPPKVSRFACKIIMDSLPTWCSKKKRNREVSKQYSVYGIEPGGHFSSLLLMPTCVSSMESNC